MDIIPQKKTHWCLYLFIAFSILFVVGSFLLYRFLKSSNPEELLQNTFVQNQIKKFVPSEDQELFEMVPVFLGFQEPRTYLVLFLNNAELRPGGGFIGSYATIRVDKGQVEVLKVEGTELLDRNTPDSWKPEPPPILKKELVVDRWFFRDSNWSPDFTRGAVKALEFYAAEGGVAAAEIDGVVGFTPEVLKELLELTGPMKVSGFTFTSENVFHTLEYEVEYGFAEKGVPVEERKNIIGELMFALLDQVKHDVFTRPKEYLERFQLLAQEKQLFAYMKDETVQQKLAARDWSGQVKAPGGDYLLWTDANLGALKTDLVMKRNLVYSITPEENAYRASAKMEYRHTGKFDKFTTRYRTYARVFVPKGATLDLVLTDSGRKGKKLFDPAQIDQGEELGKTWFGVFFVLEPGEQGSVEFHYLLPPSLTEEIKTKNSYTLTVQKQLGSLGTGLTLQLDFGKNIRSATPGEEQKEWGDKRYVIKNDLQFDREFQVNF